MNFTHASRIFSRQRTKRHTATSNLLTIEVVKLILVEFDALADKMISDGKDVMDACRAIPDAQWGQGWGKGYRTAGRQLKTHITLIKRDMENGRV